MNISMLSLQWLLLIFPLVSISVTAATSSKIPRLSPFRGSTFLDPEIFPAPVSEDFQTFFYTQTLDHFNYKPESYSTFQQRYVINFKYWAGADSKAPIFVYLGAEDSQLDFTGFLPDNALRFKSLLVYTEHRYYGKSIPFASSEEALKNASTLGYFNSAQAIADYAEIIMHIKNKYKAQDSPVIVVGGSYGGMLASWFRLKYPHVALGALASSAPILYFYDITPQNGYYSVVTRDFREVSETCYRTILKSWSEIDRVASMPNGLAILSEKFRTCRPLNGSPELKDYLDSMYCWAAQYNDPPNYPVTMVCGGIDGVPPDTDLLGKIFAGVVGLIGNRSCYVNAPEVISDTDRGWLWQTCSEMVMPIGTDNTTMFRPSPFNLSSYIEECNLIYGVPPRPHWVTSYYGGHDIKLILGRFASNIIFSNGLRDPYSSGGVLEDISDSVVAVHTINVSHCLDILQADPSTDPDWLVKQREIEVEIIEAWIAQYYADLRRFKQKIL